jgi:hypothetical protein
MTITRFKGDSYPLRRSEGDVFYCNLRYCSWKWKVRVNPIPRGASRNWAKTFHPRNVGTTKFVIIFVNMSQGLSWLESFLEGASLFFLNFADPLIMCEINYQIGIRITGLFFILGRMKSWFKL